MSKKKQIFLSREIIFNNYGQIKFKKRLNLKKFSKFYRHLS